MKQELIISVNPRIPTTGTNAGKQQYVINGKYWSNTEPSREDTHVCLDDVPGKGKHEGKTFENVVGFAKDVRMSIQSKIKLVTEVDASYSTALAMLLK